jgi:hypothetical protein
MVDERMKCGMEMNCERMFTFLKIIFMIYLLTANLYLRVIKLRMYFCEYMQRKRLLHYVIIDFYRNLCQLLYADRNI